MFIPATKVGFAALLTAAMLVGPFSLSKAQTAPVSKPVAITATPAAVPTANSPATPTRTARSRRGTANAATANSSLSRTARQNNVTEDKPLLPIATLSNPLGIASGTPIQVRLSAPIDSAHAKNGDTLSGTLAEPLGNMPAGTPVTLTIVSSVAAGRMQSFGELSIQVITVGGHPLLSNVISTQGQEGHKDVADSAPAKGTEAAFPADQPITLPAA